MKTITRLFIVLIFEFGVRANAQITLLNFYPPTANLESVYLSHSGFKFVNWHSDSLSFYNLNLSLYENVIIPAPLGYSVGCISEGLFDTDTSHIDYMLSYGDSIVIYKDNGNVVYRNDSVTFHIITPGLQGPLFFPIIATDSGAFMELTVVSSNISELYKLPGSVPCIPGCSGSLASAMPTIRSNGNGTMSIYPNPSVSFTNIYYTLPPGTNEGELAIYDLAGRILKKYTVTSQFDHLQLTTSDIAVGTYFYQLSANGNNISTKKVIVVK